MYKRKKGIINEEILENFWNNNISNYIIRLINNGKWFIVQGYGGRGEGQGGVPAMDLNGIEYGLLPMYWGIIPIVIVLSWELISFIYNKIKATVK